MMHEADTHIFEFLLIKEVNQHKKMEVDVDLWKQSCRLCCPWPKTWALVRSVHWLQL